MNGIRTFEETPEGSAALLGTLQELYGSAKYKTWQDLRQQFYSYKQYPLAGVSSLTFFSDATGSGSTTLQLTNMPSAANLAQTHLLLKSVRCRWLIKTWDLQAWTGLNADTLYSDLIDGLFQAGVMTLSINSMEYMQIVKPFLYAPPGDGREQIYTAGVDGTFTISAGLVTDAVFAAPYATLNSRRDSYYKLDPNIFIEAAQNFTFTISWPSGLIPIIASSVVNDTTNPLYVGIEIDGIWFRPLS